MVRRSIEVSQAVKVMLQVLSPFPKFKWMTEGYFKKKSDREILALWNQYKTYAADIRIHEECGLPLQYEEELNNGQMDLFKTIG